MFLARIRCSLFYSFKPISSKFLFSHLILHFMQWTSAKKIFDLDKKRFCYECLKSWKSYFLAVDPCRWSQHRHAQSCDVDSGTCDFRLDLSRLFYLCKFSFMVHAKCSFPACCMNCEWWTKMATNLNVFKTSKKDCILSKSNFAFVEVHWVRYRIR